MNKKKKLFMTIWSVAMICSLLLSSTTLSSQAATASLSEDTDTSITSNSETSLSEEEASTEDAEIPLESENSNEVIEISTEEDAIPVNNELSTEEDAIPVNNELSTEEDAIPVNNELSTEEEEKNFDMDYVYELVAKGEFDSSSLTEQQIAYIINTYNDDPQSITELQKQSDYNASDGLSLYTTYTHDARFANGYSIINGIDVSSYQGDIDWAKVKASGIDFAIIRVAYRGWGESGSLNVDEMGIKNIEAAMAAGVDVGVYIYSQAITAAEAREEANFVITLVRNYSLELPIVMDVEYAAEGGRLYNANLTAAQQTTICNTFCSTVESYNYTAMVYANKYNLSEDMNAAEIAKNYPIWLAQYNTQTTYAGEYSYWQYSSTGSVSGISGNVDMNFRYLKSPDAVTGIKKADATTTSITLSWTKIPGAYGYQISRYDAAKGQYVFLSSIRGANNTTYTNSALSENTNYKYKVRAVYKLNNGNVYGAFSSELSANTLSEKVQGLSASATNSTAIALTWNSVKNAYAYRLYLWNDTTSAWNPIANIYGENNTTYKHTGLTSNKSYTYCVRAVFKSGNQLILAPISDSLTTYTGVPAVTGLKASGVTDSSLKLSWNKVSGADGYELYHYDTAQKKYVFVQRITNASTTSYTVTNLAAGITHTFYIKPYRIINNSYYYGTGTTYNVSTTPGKISGFTVSATNSNAIALKWDAQESVDGYRLYLWDAAASKWNPIANISGANNNTYKHTGLTSNKSYTYCVRAVYKSGGQQILAPISDSLTTYTGVSAVTGMNVNGCSNSSINLTWNKVSGADGYELFRYDTSQKKYVLIERITNAATTARTVTGLSEITTYQFYIKPYRIINNSYYYGTGTTYYASTSPAKVDTVLSYEIGNKTILKWTVVSNADGYSVYRYDKNKKTYTLLADLSGATNRYYMVDTVSSSSYSYHVLSYRTYNNRKYKSTVSAAARSGSTALFATVNGNGINVRTGAGTNYNILTNISTGRTVKIIGSAMSGSALWYQVSFEISGKTYTGYMLSNYLKLN